MPGISYFFKAGLCLSFKIDCWSAGQLLSFRATVTTVNWDTGINFFHGLFLPDRIQTSISHILQRRGYPSHLVTLEMGVGMESIFSLTLPEWLYRMIEYSLNKNERRNKNIHDTLLVLPSTYEEGNFSCSPWSNYCLNI